MNLNDFTRLINIYYKHCSSECFIKGELRESTNLYTYTHVLRTVRTVPVNAHTCVFPISLVYPIIMYVLYMYRINCTLHMHST